MEASAFYETAVRFSSSELIFCLKIISDNELSAVEKIHPKQVTALIAVNLATIELLLKHLATKAETLNTPEPKLFRKLIDRYHFSVNERMQLKNQLSRWNVVTDQRPLEFDEASLHSGKDALRWLNLKINSTDFYL